MPAEFEEAMMIHPGLRKCLNCMAVAYMDNTGGYISTTDYHTGTFIMPKRLFECPNKRMRVYVVFREMAGVCCYHLKGDLAGRPNPDEMRNVYLRRFPEWEECELKCADWGWRFKYPM